VVVADGVGIGDYVEHVERRLVTELGGAAQQQHRAIDRGELFAGDDCKAASLELLDILGGQVERDEFAAAIAEAFAIGVDPVAFVTLGALGLGLAAGEQPLARIIVEIVGAIVGVTAIVGQIVIAARIVIVAAGRTVIIVINACCATIVVVAARRVVIAACCAVIISVIATGSAVIVPGAIIAACVIAASIVAADIVAANVISADVIPAHVVAANVVAADVIAADIVFSTGILIIGVGDVVIIIAGVGIKVVVAIARILRGELFGHNDCARAQRHAEQQQISGYHAQLHRWSPIAPARKDVRTDFVPYLARYESGCSFIPLSCLWAEYCFSLNR
jgi:hypothetical protein